PRPRTADDRASIGSELDETAGLELPEGLADRSPADAERRGNGLLAQLRPRRDLPGEHLRLQVSGQQVCEGGTARGAGFVRVHPAIDPTTLDPFDVKVD